MIYRGFPPQYKQQQTQKQNLCFLEIRCSLSKFSNRQQGSCPANSSFLDSLSYELWNKDKGKEWDPEQNKGDFWEITCSRAELQVEENLELVRKISLRLGLNCWHCWHMTSPECPQSKGEAQGPWSRVVRDQNQRVQMQEEKCAPHLTQVKFHPGVLSVCTSPNTCQ